MAVPSLLVIRHGCLLHSLAHADPRLHQWRDMVSGPGNVPVYVLCVAEAAITELVSRHCSLTDYSKNHDASTEQ